MKVFRLSIGWLLACPLLVCGETFDLVSFTPPANWERSIVQNDHVAFVGYNPGRTAFCQLIVYTSRASAGNALRDFEDEWNDLVKKKSGAPYEGKPQVNERRNGWTAITASGRVRPANATPYTASLTSLVGAGRVASVLVTNFGPQAVRGRHQPFCA